MIKEKQDFEIVFVQIAKDRLLPNASLLNPGPVTVNSSGEGENFASFCVGFASPAKSFSPNKSCQQLPERLEHPSADSCQTLFSDQKLLGLVEMRDKILEEVVSFDRGNC